MTYYEFLQVTENATEEVIRMAYKALAKKYHPDVYSGDRQEAESKMKIINEAFEVLSNAEKRKVYDSFLRTQRASSEKSTQSEEPSRKEQTPTKETPKKAFKYPSGLKSGWIIGLLLFLSFTQVVHPYLESEYYDYAFVFGIVDFCLLNLIMLPIPTFVGIKKSITPKGIKLLCAINSIAVLLVGIVLDVLEITAGPLVGWMLVLFYYFINKHVLLQIKQYEFKKIEAIFVVFVILLILAGAFFGLGGYAYGIIRGDSVGGSGSEMYGSYFDTQETFEYDSFQSYNNVVKLSDYNFFYYEEESVYVLLFALRDSNENLVKISGEVDVAIFDNVGKAVYVDYREFSRANYERWIFDGTKELSLKELSLIVIYIKPEDISPSTSVEGTISFTVRAEGYEFEDGYKYDEKTLSVYNLPTVKNLR